MSIRFGGFLGETAKRKTDAMSLKGVREGSMARTYLEELCADSFEKC
jgi:hypothetical protein